MTWRTLLLVLLAALGLFLWWSLLREPTWEKYYRKGIVYTQEGAYEEALTEFLKAISEASEEGGPGATTTMTESYLLAADLAEFRLGRPQRALELYRKLSETLPDHARTLEARLGMARLYTDTLNQPNEAIVTYKGLLNDWPQDPRLAEVPAQIVRLYIREHDFQQAVVEAREFLEADPARPDGPVLRFLAGDALGFVERHAEALEAYQTVITGHPDSPEAKLARFEIGNCLLKLGRNAEALAAFEDALLTYPNPDVVKLRILKAQLALKQEAEAGQLPWKGESLQGRTKEEGPGLIDPFPEDKRGGRPGQVAPPSPENPEGEETPVPLEDLDPPELDTFERTQGP